MANAWSWSRCARGGAGRWAPRGGGSRRPNEPARPPLLVLVGPTAAGKTDLAVRRAQQVGGEIVSADSRQVYRGMDIGTAKPTPDERALAPHHLIDVVEPAAEFTLARH